MSFLDRTLEHFKTHQVPLVRPIALVTEFTCPRVSRERIDQFGKTGQCVPDSSRSVFEEEVTCRVEGE